MTKPSQRIDEIAEQDFISRDSGAGVIPSLTYMACEIRAIKAYLDEQEKSNK